MHVTLAPDKPASSESDSPSGTQNSTLEGLKSTPRAAAHRAFCLLVMKVFCSAVCTEGVGFLTGLLGVLIWLGCWHAAGCSG